MTSGDRNIPITPHHVIKPASRMIPLTSRKSTAMIPAITAKITRIIGSKMANIIISPIIKANHPNARLISHSVYLFTRVDILSCLRFTII